MSKGLREVVAFGKGIFFVTALTQFKLVQFLRIVHGLDFSTDLLSEFPADLEMHFCCIDVIAKLSSTSWKMPSLEEIPSCKSISEVLVAPFWVSLRSHFGIFGPIFVLFSALLSAQNRALELQCSAGTGGNRESHQKMIILDHFGSAAGSPGTCNLTVTTKMSTGMLDAVCFPKVC